LKDATSVRRPSSRGSSSKNSVLLNTKNHSKDVEVIQIVLWIVDNGCSKHMTGNLKLLKFFVEKFMGTVRFGNDHFVAITGYGDYVHGNVTICRVYYVKGLGHNLFSVGQFCDGNLEVAFLSKTCCVRNLEGGDLLTGARDSNLYTISISDMTASFPVCLMFKVTLTKSWLWHRRLSHLNFGTINHHTKQDLVDGLLKFKYDKDYLCSVCEWGKSKKTTYPPKSNEGEPSVLFGREFLVTSKSKVDFRVGEMRIDLTMLEDERDVDALLMKLVENMEEVGSLNGEQKENIKEALDRKYKELEESKPILEVLENYMTYRKKLDEVMTDHASLFKNLGLSDPRPYNSNLTMADNTQAKAIGEELPLLLGRRFLRTYGAVIDMGCGSMSIDDGVIRRTYFPKTRAKGYLENFEIDEEDDWLSCFEVGRDEDGNPKYGPVAPSFLDIEDDMERSLAITPIGAMQVMEFTRRLKKATQSSHPNPLITNYAKRNSIGTIEYHLQQVKNANLKWQELQSMERYVYCERLSKLQGKEIGMPRVVDWSMFYVYSFEETLKELMKFEYIHSDGDVDRTKLIMEKCIWFRLCGHEQVLTLPQFAVLLGLYEESELEHRLFAIHFTRLEIDDKLLNHDTYWQRIGTPTITNRRTSLIKKPLMRIVHRLIVGSLVHRLGSKEMCQKRDLWMMSALEESHRINLAWVIAEHLCKHARGLKENSLICGGHYVTKITKSLGYLADEEVAKCSESIECEKYTSKMLVSELDEENCTLLQSTQVPSLPRGARKQRHEPSGLNSSWGDWNASLNEIERGNVWRDSMLIRNNYMLEHSMPILYHLADQANFAYPTYEPPNVPPYPYPYVPYPHPYMHYPDTGNQSFRGEHYRAHGNDYFAGSIVPSSGYEIGGSSGGVH
ncbi:ribonuclease H-like domain-containing protein, partial [Tanacetum coccineum]